MGASQAQHSPAGPADGRCSGQDRSNASAPAILAFAGDDQPATSVSAAQTPPCWPWPCALLVGQLLLTDVVLVVPQRCNLAPQDGDYDAVLIYVNETNDPTRPRHANPAASMFDGVVGHVGVTRNLLYGHVMCGRLCTAQRVFPGHRARALDSTWTSPPRI